MASPRIRKHAPLLRWLSKGKPGVVSAIIKDSDRDLVEAVCECVHNIVNKNVTLTASQRKKLKKHKKDLGLLLNKSTTIKKKKKALQKGGFVGAILGAVLPALIGTLAAVT